VKANNNLEANVQCIRDYISDVKGSNEKMTVQFKKDYADYM